MQKRKWKRIVVLSAAVFVGLVLVLAVHIWWVMRPRVDAGTRVLARIDLHQRIDQSDADRIQAWLYQQRGVKHVLVSPASDMALFSFAPLENDGNGIVTAFRQQMGFGKAARYLPVVDANAASGCPVAATSVAYKAYVFMKRVF
jgi:hypothetical protein